MHSSLKKNFAYLFFSKMRKKIFSLISRLRQDKVVFLWKSKGRPVPPPPIIKQRTIGSYAKKFNLKVFVETGTYHGDMIEAVREMFNHVISIELSKEFHSRAKKRFKGLDKIELICGDSGTELENVASRLNQPALFWLDGHFSGGETARGDKDTPILEELGHILKRNKKDVIIIDDARCFGSNPAYPTVDEVANFVKQRKSNSKIFVEDDSIKILLN